MDPPFVVSPNTPWSCLLERLLQNMHAPRTETSLLPRMELLRPPIINLEESSYMRKSIRNNFLHQPWIKYSKCFTFKSSAQTITFDHQGIIDPPSHTLTYKENHLFLTWRRITYPLRWRNLNICKSRLNDKHHPPTKQAVGLSGIIILLFILQAHIQSCKWLLHLH